MGRPSDHKGDGTPIPAAEAARWHGALRAALSGPALRRSARSRQLLTYLVEETLAGRRGRITGTTIAQDVLGRDASFDGEGDAIVRVQMRRLRVQLAEDHGAEELGAAPRIVVPKGAYRPELADPPAGQDAPRPEGAALGFAEAPAPPPSPRPPSEAATEPEDGAPEGPDGTRTRTRNSLVVAALAALAVCGGTLATLAPRLVDGLSDAPPSSAAVDVAATPTVPPAGDEGPPEVAEQFPSIAVLPFRNNSGDAANDVFETGLQFQIASDLQRFGTVKAFALEAPEMRGGPPPARYYIAGTILKNAEEIDVFVFLTNAETGRSVLSRRIREPGAKAGEDGDYYTVLSRLSRAVSGHMAGDYGGIVEAEELRAIASAGLDGERGLDGFRCVALSQAFLGSRSVDDYRRARDCIGTHLDEHGEDGLLMAYKAMLAFHSLPEMGLMDTRSLAWVFTEQETLALARRAVSLAPGSDAAHAIRGSILNAFGQTQEAVISLRRAADLNPGNPTIHGLLALALVADDRWEEAGAVAEDAIAISARPQPFFYIPAFLSALMADDRDAALTAAAEVARTPAPWAPTIALVAAELAGRTAEVAVLREEVRIYAEEHGGDALAGLRRWVPSERGMAALEAHLQAAGL